MLSFPPGDTAMARDITFETKCWERDWNHILDPKRLELLMERNPYPFARRVLMINNVKQPAKVRRAAERAIAAGAFTEYVAVEDHAAETLDFFALSREGLGKGYYYSISELVSVFLCRSEFLLHFAGDCIPLDASDWITPALGLMDDDPRVKVCNLTWNEQYDQAKSESHAEAGPFYIGYGFSDQCYLVRTADFRGRIYGESHPDSARYPEYGGELFEKRVDSWMRNHGHLRATYRHASYLHRNWPLSRLDRAKLFGRRMIRRFSPAAPPP